MNQLQALRQLKRLPEQVAVLMESIDHYHFQELSLLIKIDIKNEEKKCVKNGSYRIDRNAIRRRSFESYEEKLRYRSYYVEGLSVIALDDEKRQVLLSSFSSWLDRELESIFSSLSVCNLGSDQDIQDEINALEEKLVSLIDIKTNLSLIIQSYDNWLLLKD